MQELQEGNMLIYSSSKEDKEMITRKIEEEAEVIEGEEEIEETEVAEAAMIIMAEEATEEDRV
jgi:hypothetical protein